MELFMLLLIIWSATIAPFLILLGINLVCIWMKGWRVQRSSHFLLKNPDKGFSRD
jgi:hypothetical protein